jgi:peptide/nickel transport system substrate-binding protein
MGWLKKIFGALSRKERLAFVVASAGAIVSFVVVMGFVITQSTRAVPTQGGEYTEGALGQPEYINPVIATSQTDLDLSKLVYSNLSDIADSITPSADLQTWDVRLKEGLTWQDGQKLTSDDVVFTVQSIQNKDANSPLYQSWQGVSVSRVSELEVEFTLANPYAYFGDNLKNLYIIPKHIFADTPPGNWHLSDYNLKPIGSGPYKFLSYDKTADGYISEYHLQAWNASVDGNPLIQNFNFSFFNDENTLVQSFNSGQIDGFGNASPDDVAAIKRPYDTFSWRTSGYYAVFFNQSKNLALQDPVVRQALSMAIDRNDLITTALGGAGVPEYGPVPPGATNFTDVSPSSTPSLSAASSLLDNDGWTVDPSSTFRSKTISKSSIPLVVNLTVPQIDFLANTADYLRNAWQSIGVQTNVVMDSPGTILNDAVVNRNYEGLLFGNVLGPSSDLYSFWDSSQDFSPGLNLSIYKNTSVDSLIEAARQTNSSATTTQDLATAQAKIAADYPAVFLYSPNYVYITNKNVQGINPNLLSDPSDRFLEVVHWYLNTARVLN